MFRNQLYPNNFQLNGASGETLKVPIIQVGGTAIAPPSPPVIMVVLFHTEAAVKDFCLHKCL